MIHVNGTRGKTGIVRLIHAGLSYAGKVAISKTTGTNARIIHFDSNETSVRRWSRPSILEQIRFLTKAFLEKAKIVIVECMAIDPKYQFASEIQIVRSNIGIISNVRNDHLEVMGPSLVDVQKAFANAIPKNGRLVLHRGEFNPIWEKACLDRNTSIHFVEDNTLEFVSDRIISQFRYLEHKENIAMALQVCEMIGVSKEVSIQGMMAMKPYPGALELLRIQFFGKDFFFLNALAANDPESSRKIWTSYKQKLSEYGIFQLLFHCREDRMNRSIQLAQEIAKWEGFSTIFLTGEGTQVAIEALKRYPKKGMQVFNLEGYPPEQVFESILANSPLRFVLVGIGNIGGEGLEIVKLFKNRSSH